MAMDIENGRASLDRAYRDAIAMVGDAVMVVGEDGRCVDANDAALTLLRYDRDALLSRSVEELVVGPANDVGTTYSRFLIGDGWDGAVGADGTWSGVVELRRGDGTTVRVQAEARVRHLEGGARVGISVLRATDASSSAAGEQAVTARMETMLELAGALAGARTTPEAAAVLLRRVLPAAGAIAGVVGIVSADGTTVDIVATEGTSGVDDSKWRRFPVSDPLPLSEAIREGRPILAETLAERDERYPAVAGAGYAFDHAMANLPLLAGGRAVGGITISFPEPRSFSQDELRFLMSLAAQGAGAMERTRLRDVERTQRDTAAFLLAAGGIMAQSLDYEQTLAEVARLAVFGIDVEDDRLPGPSDWCAIDLLDDDGTIRLISVVHRDPDKIELANALRRRHPPTLDDPTGTGAVIRTGVPEIATEISDELIDAAVDDPETRAALLDLGLASALTVPLISRGRTLGALTLVSSESGRRYEQQDLAMAQTLARHAATAIDNARLFRERDHVARTLQQVLLPASLPRIEGFDIAASYTPGALGVEVGGDFYDVFARPDGSAGLVIGDVSGKGAEAAAIMGLARQAVRVIGLTTSRPSEILQRLNEALLGAEFGESIVTVCDVRLRPDATGATVTGCSAGHPLPVIVRHSGDVEVLGRPGVLLGAFPAVDLRDTVSRLTAGDAIVLYTDGLIEWGPGWDRTEDLLEVLRGTAGAPAAEIVRRVEEWWRAAMDSRSTDDAALVVVRSTPVAGANAVSEGTDTGRHTVGPEE